LLGYSYGAEVVHRDDLATVIDPEMTEGEAKA
jgi:glutamate 5-kinase